MFRHKTNFLPLALFLSYLVIPSILFAESYEGKVVNVISADILIINIGGKEYKTNLDYIATPLQGQIFYDEAKQFVEKLALNNKVTVHAKENLAFRPQALTAEVYVPQKTEPLNRELVRAGLAWCKTEKWNPYEPTLNIAKKRQLGIWSETNPVAPWEFKNKLPSIINAAAIQKDKEFDQAQKRRKVEDEKFLQEYGDQIKKAQAEEESKRLLKNKQREQKAIEDKRRIILSYTANDIRIKSGQSLSDYIDDLKEVCLEKKNPGDAPACTDQIKLTERIATEKYEEAVANRQRVEKEWDDFRRYLLRISYGRP